MSAYFVFRRRLLVWFPSPNSPNQFLLVQGFAMRTAQPDAGILLILENGQKGVEEARVLLCL